MLDRPDLDKDAGLSGAPMAVPAPGWFVVDGQGRILEAGGDHALAGPRRAPNPRKLAELEPKLDLATFATLRKMLDAAPDAVVQLELPGSLGSTVCRLRRTDTNGRYLAHLGDAGTGARTRIDAGVDADYRQRLEQRLAFEHLIAGLSTDLINVSAQRLDALVEDALGRIGTFFEVDRAYVFRFNADRDLQSNTHEWVADGISREAAKLQDIPLGHYPWLMPQLLAGREVHVPDTAVLPDAAIVERTEFVREHIRSLVLVPFGGPDGTEGFIGFDSVHRMRTWSPGLLLGLKLVSQMFINAFRSQEMSGQLVALALQDPLTGLRNRRFLADGLASAMRRSQRAGSQLAVIAIDLDDFKLINDSYGHDLGDQVLRTTASRITQAVRAGDLVARLGGDEFVVVAEIDQPAALMQLLERLLAASCEPIELPGMAVLQRLSAGVALYPDDGDDAERLVSQADAAMYEAKAEGKGRFAFFSRRMIQDSRAALRLRHDLRLALERDEIFPHYQPRVALPSGRVLGFEALARWQHPQRGLLLPADFLGLAGSGGAIGEIDLRILACALADLGRWRHATQDCRVAVNLDASDLQDKHWVARLQVVLADLGDAAANLELEITESSLMRDIDAAARTLHALREAAPGLRVAIDDFGSGYSSLEYLVRLPVTTLKIDRAFTAALDTRQRPHPRAIIKSIINLGNDVGLRVVAEGVETSAQAEVLCELGCKEAQGFLFSGAVPASAATAMLASKSVQVFGGIAGAG